MLRAAPWNLGRKQQKLRLLTRPPSLELRYTISTSNTPYAAAYQHVAEPRGDENASTQPPSRNAENTSSYPKPTAKGPMWEVLSPLAPGSSRLKVTKQESRARNRKKRLSRDTELNKFHKHVQQRLAVLPPFDDASTLQRISEDITSDHDFARKFTARRSDAPQLHESGLDPVPTELAFDLGSGDREETGEPEKVLFGNDSSIAGRNDAKVADIDTPVDLPISPRFDQTVPQEPQTASSNGGHLPNDPTSSQTADAQLKGSSGSRAAPTDKTRATQLNDCAQQRRATGVSPQSKFPDRLAKSRGNTLKQHESETRFLGLLHGILEQKGWSRQEKSKEANLLPQLPRNDRADDFRSTRHDTTEPGGSPMHAAGVYGPTRRNGLISTRARSQQPEALSASTQAEFSGVPPSASNITARPPSSDVHFKDIFSKIFDNSASASADEGPVSSEHYGSSDASGYQSGPFKDRLDELVDQIDQLEHEAPPGVTEHQTTSFDDSHIRNERRHVAIEKFKLSDEALGFSYTTIAKAPSSNFDKSWGGSGPSWWIHCCVSGNNDQHLWRTHIAKLRTVRPPIIAIQLLIRRDALRLGKTDDRRSILQHLPQGATRRSMIEKMATLGIGRSYLNSICDVLEANSDQERCRRFLAAGGPKPIWLLNFLLRPQSSMQDPDTLTALIDYSTTTFCRTWNNHDKGDAHSELSKVESASEAIAPEDFAHVVLLFAMRAMTVETRLLPRIAEMAAQYIERMNSADWHPSKIFFDQCELFNAALAAFRPSKLRVPSTVHRWMPPHWEAQKILLNMSTNLPKQLLVDRLGYQSVREVLSMLDKDQNEMHNALRHRESWPPYLDPSDGIDEATDPETNWSRAVSAGTLQQDAGYPLSPQDEALDTIQGRASNLTPTIRQRVTNVPHSDVSPWEASIRATRNVQEAWDRFRSPPHPNAKPGVHEFGALLTKYLTHEARPDDMDLPGDKALVFPTKEDPNLTEFEKTRRRPPTIGMLLGMMKQSQVKLTGAVLVRLLSKNGSVSANLTRSGERIMSQRRPLHASYVRTARIFGLSNLRPDQYAPLLETKVKDNKALRKVPLPIFAAYIQHLASFRPVAPQLLLRAMRFCEARFSNDKEATPWAQHCWGMLLKSTARRPRDARFLTHGLVSQINNYHYILSSIATQAPLTLSTTMEFAKSVNKASRRVLTEFWSDAGDEKELLRSPLVALFGRENQRASTEQRIAGIRPDCIAMMQSLCRLVARLTKTVKTLIDNEARVQTLLTVPLAQHVDGMMARSDPVRASEAERLMRTWVYAGEYETAAWYLEWLVEQWDSAQLQKELKSLLAVPPFADFSTSLAVFERYAEPFLPADRVTLLRKRITDARVGWQWPTPETMEEKLRGANRARARLQYVQAWTRFWQAKERNEDVDSMALPGHWMDLWDRRVPDREEEEKEEGDMGLQTEVPRTWDGIPWPKNTL